jgi:hypothetical protein
LYILAVVLDFVKMVADKLIDGLQAEAEGVRDREGLLLVRRRCHYGQGPAWICFLIGGSAPETVPPQPSDEWRLLVGYNCSAEIAAAADSPSDKV